jgi:hypothetical protein
MLENSKESMNVKEWIYLSLRNMVPWHRIFDRVASHNPQEQSLLKILIKLHNPWLCIVQTTTSWVLATKP